MKKANGGACRCDIVLRLADDQELATLPLFATDPADLEDYRGSGREWPLRSRDIQILNNIRTVTVQLHLAGDRKRCRRILLKTVSNMAHQQSLQLILLSSLLRNYKAQE